MVRKWNVNRWMDGNKNVEKCGKNKRCGVFLYSVLIEVC